MAMSKRERKKYLLRKNHERLARAKKGGFVQFNVLIDLTDKEAIQARARLLKIPSVSVGRAIVKVGLRNLKTSDAIREEQRWRTLFRRPAVPRYPGADFDPSLRYSTPKKETSSA